MATSSTRDEIPRGSTQGPAARRKFFGGLAAVVGALALVEITSGIIQGFYTPILTDIARRFEVHDADVNWLEAAQFMFAALAVPILAKLGDLYGHRLVLLVTTAVVAGASFTMALAPGFLTFLVGWTLQGAYVVWLPLEVALIYLAARESAKLSDAAHEVPALTRRATGFLVAALELGVIGGALTAGALAEVLSLSVILLIPAVAVAACFFVVLFMVPKDPAHGRAKTNIDVTGVVLLSLSLGTFMAGLVLVRSVGFTSPWPWLLVVVSLAILAPFVRHERRHPEPIIDVDMLKDRSMWPIQLVAGLFGVSILGAQAPLSTFARTDPAEVGYGVGLSAAQVSYAIGVYVVALLVGALLYAPVAQWLTPRLALVVASVLVSTGFMLFLPFHESLVQLVGNMLIIGLGSGALVAALPAAAAAAAPQSRTGMATGLINTSKTIGGAISSAVFGVALLQGVSNVVVEAGQTAAPLSGYLTVWALCGITAACCAVLLLLVPKRALTSVSAR